MRRLAGKSAIVTGAGSGIGRASALLFAREGARGLAVDANAGIGGGLTPLFQQSVELWRETLRVNPIAPFLAIQRAAPKMIARGGGSIVLAASVAALRANAGGHLYSASKAGVIRRRGFSPRSHSHHA